MGGRLTGVIFVYWLSSVIVHNVTQLKSVVCSPQLHPIWHTVTMDVAKYHSRDLRMHTKKGKPIRLGAALFQPSRRSCVYHITNTSSTYLGDDKANIRQISYGRSVDYCRHMDRDKNMLVVLQSVSEDSPEDLKHGCVGKNR